MGRSAAIRQGNVTEMSYHEIFMGARYDQKLGEFENVCTAAHSDDLTSLTFLFIAG